MPDIATCRASGCHGGATPVPGMVASTCIDCHDYHLPEPHAALARPATTHPGDEAMTCSHAHRCACPALVLAACGGGGGGGGTSNAPPAPNLLTVSDVEKIVAQAIAEAQAQSAKATIAVVDRVGNLLAVYTMTGASPTVRRSTPRTGDGRRARGHSPAADDVRGDLDGGDGAYLSSSGNAFTSRTASQIVQDHFNPNENKQPGGPLFGVQFSQLTCSDLITTPTSSHDRPEGARRSALSAEPGGLPLYKNGVVVGGIGVMATGTYSLDLDILNYDTNVNELDSDRGHVRLRRAQRRARRSHHRGRSHAALRRQRGREVQSGDGAGVLRHSPDRGKPDRRRLSAEARSSPGTAFGDARVGHFAPTRIPRSPAPARSSSSTDANVNRYPPRAGTDELLTAAGSDADPQERDRSRQPRPRPDPPAGRLVGAGDDQRRRHERRGPGPHPARPTRRSSAPTSPCRRRARRRSSRSLQAAAVAVEPAARDLPSARRRVDRRLRPATRGFLNDPNAFANGIAYGNRGIGNLARPYFPDGITGANAGPLSVRAAELEHLQRRPRSSTSCSTRSPTRSS